MKDFINAVAAGDKSAELHGHAKITLTDANGNKEIIEHDNVVTDTIQNIFKSNMNGALNFSNLLPITKLFSGCLLYNTGIEEVSENLCNIPAGAELIAHSGSEAYTGLDTTAGNPNELESGKITNGYKYVFDWGTSAGNGTLNCVSLTASKGGFNGRNYADPSKTAFNIVSNAIGGRGTADKLFFKCALFNWEQNKAYEVLIDGSVLTINQFGFGGATVSLFDDLIYNINNKERSYNFTLEQRPSGNYSLQLIDKVIYLVFTTSSTSIHLIKIDLDNNSKSERNISYTGASFQQSFHGNYPVYNWRVNLFPIVGNYIYIPKHDNMNFYKCNLEITADIAELPSKLTRPPYMMDDVENNEFTSTSYGAVILENGNLLYNSCSIINDEVYPNKSYTDETGHAYANIFGAGTRLMPGVYLVHSVPSYTDCRYGQICLTSESITTINLLNEAITKTADKTMKLEYTIYSSEG